MAVQEDERLGEVRYGDWTGQPLKRLAKDPLWRVVQAHPERGPVPRRGRRVHARTCSTGRSAAVRDWNARLGREATYMICSHGDVIKSMIADSLGMHLDLFQRIQVDPCSLTAIRYTPLRPFLLRMNDTGGTVSGLVRPDRRPTGHSTATRRRGGRRRSGRIGPCRSIHTIRRTGSSPGRSASPASGRFYLQASAAGRVTSVALEKVQVSLLAERLDELLDEVLRRTGGRVAVPAAAPAELADDAPLDLPLMEEFRVGAIALAWDGEDERVVIEAQEETENPVEPLAEEVPEDGPGVLRVRITAGGGPCVLAAGAADRGAGAARRARCAGCRWTRRATSAPGRTATGSAMPEPVSGTARAAAGRTRPGPAGPARGARTSRQTVPAGDGDGPLEDQAALELLTRGALEVEGRLVEASNATLYCTHQLPGHPGGLRLQAGGG